MRSTSKFSARFSTSMAALFALTAMAWVAGCSYQQKEESNSGNLKVQVPVYTQGSYQLSVVELNSVSDLTHLKGSTARLLIEPRIVKNQLRGRDPDVHYMRNSHGVIVATDADSLQMISLYAQFENLRKLDKSVGVESANKWPVRVVVNARTLNSTGAIEDNNAFYDGGSDAYLFAPYNQSQLPLAVNSGVIGHEHFHSLFQHLVIEPLKDKYPNPNDATAHDEKARLKSVGMSAIAGEDAAASADETGTADINVQFNSLLLRGLNEGLADVWGWIYSGDENFVQRSLSYVGTSRSLSFMATGLPSQAQFMANVVHALEMPDQQKAQMLGYLPYQFGTQAALTLKWTLQHHFPDKDDEGLRQEAAKLIVAALPAIRDQIGALSSTSQTLVPADLVTTLVMKIPNLTSDDCQWLVNFIPLDDQKKNTCSSAIVTGGAAQ